MPRVRMFLGIAGWTLPVVAAMMIIGSIVVKEERLFGAAVGVGAVGMVLQMAYRSIRQR